MEPAAIPPKLKLSQRLTLALLPPLAGALIRMWAWTWRVSLPVPPDRDPHSAEKRYIYAFWHEGIVTIIPHWRDSKIQGLASQSFDGELIARLMHFLGYPPLARGSSSRGGVSALKAQIDGLAQGLHVAISVDGPRGPRYQAKAGVVQLAIATGASIIPVGAVARPDWRLRNWDKTMVPPPFARVAFVLGEAVKVGKNDQGEALAEVNRSLMAALDEAARFHDKS